jgi:hypothetical protein
MEVGKRETGNGKGEDGRGKRKAKRIAREEGWRMGNGKRETGKEK